MKNLNYSLLRIVCALVVGLILVLFTDRAGEYLVITLGVVFVVPALAGIITYFVQRHKGNMYFPLEGVGSLLFGLWLIVMPDFFANLLTIALGIVLMLGGIQQIISLFYLGRSMKVSIGFYIVPALILIAGIVAVFSPKDMRFIVFMILGISSLVYAFSEMVTWFVFKRRMKDVTRHARKYVDVEDAEIVDEE